MKYRAYNGTKPLHASFCSRRISMTTKTISRISFYVAILVLLAACAPAQPNIPEIQTQAVAMAKTSIALTQTALPTIAPTLTFVYPTPSPFSTEPPLLLLTPDAIQVERWKEYQRELAKVVISSNPESGNDPAIYKDALCEWDILGQSDDEIYVYAVCASFNYHAGMRSPAIIYINPDGSIRKVTVPGYKGMNYDLDPFPINVQEKLCFYNFNQCNESIRSHLRLDALYAHLEYRKYHPEEPPLVVLSALPTATPTP